MNAQYYKIAEGQRKSRERHDHDDVDHVPLKQESAAAVSAETEELLDEIDSVLEENAQEFVDNYIQQTGE